MCCLQGDLICRSCHMPGRGKSPESPGPEMEKMKLLALNASSHSSAKVTTCDLTIGEEDIPPKDIFIRQIVRLAFIFGERQPNNLTNKNVTVCGFAKHHWAPQFWSPHDQFLSHARSFFGTKGYCDNVCWTASWFPDKRNCWGLSSACNIWTCGATERQRKVGPVNGKGYCTTVATSKRREDTAIHELWARPSEWEEDYSTPKFAESEVKCRWDEGKPCSFKTRIVQHLQLILRRAIKSLARKP